METRDYKDTLYSLERRRAYKSRVDLLLRAYSTMGALMAVLGAGYFAVTLLPFEITSEQRIALMVSGIGASLAFMSRTLVLIRKEREQRYAESIDKYQGTVELLRAWSDLESASKRALGRDQSRSHSLRAVFDELYERGKIDDSDMIVLEEALRARNAAAHGGEPLPPDTAERLIQMISKVIIKLSPFG